VPQLGDLVPPALQTGVVEQVVRELTYPHGVASLSQNDAYFHPYHHDQIYHFDAAYHNGLCWHWTAGPVITGLIRAGRSDLAFQLTQNLAEQILRVGMPGALSELVEPLPVDGAVKPSGTYSQAWSSAEFVRTIYQDYLGLQPRLSERCLILCPRLPAVLTDVAFRCCLGRGEFLDGEYRQRAESLTVTLNGTGLAAALTVRFRPTPPTRFLKRCSMSRPPGRWRLSGRIAGLCACN
jgi:glycogen debranching enzyme